MPPEEHPVTLTVIDPDTWHLLTDGQRELLRAWIRQHGIEVNDVLLHAPVTITDTTLTCELIVRNKEGRAYLDGDDLATRTYSCPLAALPPKLSFSAH